MNTDYKYKYKKYKQLYQHYKHGGSGLPQVPGDSNMITVTITNNGGDELTHFNVPHNTTILQVKKNIEGFKDAPSYVNNSNMKRPMIFY